MDFTSAANSLLLAITSTISDNFNMATDAVSDYVMLVASDGYSFVVRRSAACISDVIARMLNPSSESFTLCSLRLLIYSRRFHGVQD